MLSHTSNHKTPKPFRRLALRNLASAWTSCSDYLGNGKLKSIIFEVRRKIARPTFKPTPESWDSNAVTASWLGHSTVLLNFFGVTILTDPILTQSAGIDFLHRTIGARRLVAPALSIRELPPIDLVLLSHAHMDHLNFATLLRLPGSPSAVTARSTLELVRRTKIKEAVELGWGEKTRMSTARGEVLVEAFEVQHWGARWRHDRHRGYNGYVVSREGRKIVFGGDTAWTKSFRALRSKGPFDFGLMPIGAYEPWVTAHCTPEQAVGMANEAGAEYFLPIHFRTFSLGREPQAEPLDRLERAIESQRLGWREVGQTFRMPVSR